MRALAAIIIASIFILVGNINAQINLDNADDLTSKTNENTISRSVLSQNSPVDLISLNNVNDENSQKSSKNETSDPCHGLLLICPPTLFNPIHGEATSEQKMAFDWSQP